MILLSLLVLFAGQDAGAAESPKPVLLSKELGLTGLSDVESALSRPLADIWRVKLAGGIPRRVKTCRDLLEVSKVRFELENAVDWPVWWQQGSRCFALDALKRARPALRTHLSWFRLSKTAIAKLPPGLALLQSLDELEDAAAAEKACRSWGRFDETLKVEVQPPDSAVLRSDGWTGRLILYARADIDGDGIEDLLLRRDAHVRGGTAAESRVFIVTQTSPSDCPRIIRAMGAPDESESP
jgi:hypothetical protein